MGAGRLDAAERIRRDAGLAAEQELLRARKELREEAATIASELALQLLADSVNEGDRDRLLDEFISPVENGTGR